MDEDVKHEMYKLYKENPRFWNVHRIASKFGITPERCAAIIRFFFFLKKRKHLIVKKKKKD